MDFTSKIFSLAEPLQDTRHSAPQFRMASFRGLSERFLSDLFDMITPPSITTIKRLHCSHILVTTNLTLSDILRERFVTPHQGVPWI